jgi:hypothetical protein
LEFFLINFSYLLLVRPCKPVELLQVTTLLIQYCQVVLQGVVVAGEGAVAVVEISDQMGQSKQQLPKPAGVAEVKYLVRS